ncbi:hypothetical protein, partial [Xanthomonas sp. SHU 199]|uniref:hypothetical protein n=1 Tax=Xanthomonas sp. SHU 199 TaxID=1591174 RepID=UPI001E4EC026
SRRTTLPQERLQPRRSIPMNVGAAEDAPANAGSQALSLPHTLQRAAAQAGSRQAATHMRPQAPLTPN